MAVRKKRAKKQKASALIIDEINPGFSTRSARGKTSNAKGKSYEREIANALKPLYPKARRSFGQAREGHETPDVVGTPFWIEASKGSTRAITDKVRQGLSDSARSDGEYGGAPVIVFSRAGAGNLHLATMERSEFLALLQRGRV